MMNLPKAKLRVIDVMTEDEKKKVSNYEKKIIEARTPIEIYIYKRRAKHLIKNAKQRYIDHRENFRYD